MPRTDLYLKVIIEHEPEDSPEKLGAQICRQIEKVYGVREAEVSSFISQVRSE